jgi:hypothetical protein
MAKVCSACKCEALPELKGQYLKKRKKTEGREVGREERKGGRKAGGKEGRKKKEERKEDKDHMISLTWGI